MTEASASVLTLDVGNSTYGLGRWEADEVTVERFSSAQAAARSIDGPVVAVSVAPARLANLVEALAALGKPPPRLLTGSPVSVADPRLLKTAGADRLATAAAVLPGPAVVVDAGTAVTVDAIGPDGVFGGGFIAPGLAAAIAGLARAAPALPGIPGRAVPLVLGLETLGAMEAGAFWLVIGGVDRLVEAARAHLVGVGAVRLVATGGWGRSFAEATRHVGVEHDPDLIHRGIRRWALRDPS